MEQSLGCMSSATRARRRGSFLVVPMMVRSRSGSWSAWSIVCIFQTPFSPAAWKYLESVCPLDSFYNTHLQRRAVRGRGQLYARMRALLLVWWNSCRACNGWLTIVRLSIRTQIHLFYISLSLYLIPGSHAPLHRICLGGDNLLLEYADGRARIWDVKTREFWRSMGMDKVLELLQQGGWTEA